MLGNVIRLEMTDSAEILQLFFLKNSNKFLQIFHFEIVAEIVLEGSLKIYTLGNEPSLNIHIVDQTKNYKCFDSLEKADYVSIFLSEKIRSKTLRSRPRLLDFPKTQVKNIHSKFPVKIFTSILTKISTQNFHQNIHLNFN